MLDKAELQKEFVKLLNPPKHLAFDIEQLAGRMTAAQLWTRIQQIKNEEVKPNKTDKETETNNKTT